MKVLKRIFYCLAALLLILCGVVLICAFNPSVSSKIGKALYGEDGNSGIVGGAKKTESANGLSAFWEQIRDIFSENNADDTADSTSDGSTVSGITSDGNGINLNGVTDGTGSTGNSTADATSVTDGGSSGGITTLPDVSNLTGYLPIESNEQQITDDAAQSIEGSLDIGETGDGYTFDELFYPFYYMLDEDGQKIYKQIYANALQLKSTFAPVADITSSELKSVFEAVVNDHPELFYLETGYSVKYTSAGKVVEITLSYYTVANDITSAKASFETAANAVIAGASALTDDYSREKYVYDALIGMIKYDASAPMSQSAYSALVSGRTVCAGYARANQYILQQLGIPCYYCTGYSGEDHAWNIVELSDGYYNEDVTWGDTTPATYDYFNKSDADFAADHVRSGMSVNLPACNGTLYRGIEKGSVLAVTVPTDTTAETEHTTPLRYDDYINQTENTTADDLAHEALVAELKEMGLTENDVIWSLTDYYTDCKAKLIAAGSGDVHFSNIVPASLFTEIEKAYGEKGYNDGYVQAALKELGMDNFSIQIQAQQIGNDYYKLYHNVVTWK